MTKRSKQPAKKRSKKANDIRLSRVHGLTAAVMIGQLMEWGLRAEGIADRMRVSLNSVLRWRRGSVQPWPGHFQTLEELFATISDQRAKGDR